MTWINARHQLPKRGHYTLIHTPNRPWHDKQYPKYQIARFEGNRWKEFGPGSFSIEEVTYWRYIDPAPDHPENWP